MPEAEATLIVIGVIVVGGFLASLAFKKLRLPEVLLLMALGIVIGPVLGWVEVEGYREISGLIGTIAIIVILFDGGLEIQFRDLKYGVARGGGLAILVFCFTAALCAGIAYLALDLSWPHAFLLGMALGGAGAVIVIPMIRQLEVKQDSVTVVAIEAAVSDVLVIVGVYGLATALEDNVTETSAFARELFFVFSIALVCGAIAGWLWSRLLGWRGIRGYEYVLTLGALFLLHVGVEHLDGAGPMAVLAFGLVVGNSKRAATFVEASTHSPHRKSATPPTAPGLVPVFTETMAGFHHEMVFLIRSFFFVGLGVVLDLNDLVDPKFLLVGLALAVAVALGRWLGVKIMYLGSSVSEHDRKSVSLMFPLGLAAAALSLVPYQQFGIEEAKEFGSYAAVVIVLTNIFCGAGVWWMSRAHRKPYQAVAGRRRGTPSAAPAPRPGPPPAAAGRQALASRPPETGTVTFTSRRR
ncbi:MAG TPA: cation:proton antiporter [Candidatus Thermoplasmatota archaeon]|nr:cation:proton antiporter [Candidatus Thermoplasmatota archaeon]